MPPIEPIHFTRIGQRPRAAAPLELPPATQEFLRATPGRQVRSVVHVFHRWLQQRRLTLRDLTPDHLRKFFVRPKEHTTYCPSPPPRRAPRARDGDAQAASIRRMLARGSWLAAPARRTAPRARAPGWHAVVDPCLMDR